MIKNIVILFLAIVAVILILNQPSRVKLGEGGTFSYFDTATNTSISCPSSTSTSVLGAASSRRYGVFTNDSANNIYLCFGSTCSASTGMRLNSNGGSYELKYDNLYVGNISCIASTATSTLTTIYLQ